MTPNEAIAAANALKPNQYSNADKLRWLNIVEGLIYNDIILTHDNPDEIEFNGSLALTDTLIASAPYDELYVQYILSQIDYNNAEFGRYNNTSEMFNTFYQKFSDHWNANYTPNVTAYLKV